MANSRIRRAGRGEDRSRIRGPAGAAARSGVAVARSLLPALALTLALPARRALAADHLSEILAGGVVALVMLALGALLVWQLRARWALNLTTDTMAALPRPCQIVDGEGGVVLSNLAFHEVFGVEARPIPELLAELVSADEEARDRVRRLAANARGGVGGYLELAVPARRSVAAQSPAGGAAAKRGGSELQWLHVTANPLPQRAGAVYWAVEDITDRRQMEQVIQGEQERFYDLIDHAPIGFYSVDGQGRFLFVNQTLADWLGLPQERLVSDATLHRMLAEPPPAGTPAHHPFADPRAERGTVTLRGADGRKFEAEVRQELVTGEEGRVVRTRSVVRHLTREREVLQALERSEERFKRFFAEAPVGIALLDAAGKVAEGNHAFYALTGRPQHGVVGVSLLDLIEGEGRATVEQLLKAAGGGPKEGAGEKLKPSGAAVFNSIEVGIAGPRETVCTLYLSRMAEEGAGYIAHFIDTTERKNLEVQFAQSQKMQAVGQLAGGIAHDFNNLLTAMIGFSDLLLLRHKPGDQSFADIMQIKQNANRAANLVRQLLAFSRQQTLQPRLLNITDILAELSHLLRRLIGENIELRMVHGRDIGLVKADQGQLEQVIINLAVNARDAMVEGGKLEIRTSSVVVKRPIRHRGEVVAPGEYVLVEAEDSGCGIAKENLGRIFDPFFSTKEVGAGTGLGLSTVYGIVKQTGGFVFVESTLGKGTTFSIYLPQHAAELVAAATAAKEREESRDLTGRGTLLLVEDEDAVRAFSSRVLRNKGYKVLEARSGEAALEVLKQENDRIDLLITDVVMPRLDGPSLVKLVRERRPDLKVIFISGYTEDSFRKRLDEDTDIHFLPKPFSLKELAGKVKEILGEEEPQRDPAASAPQPPAAVS